MKDEYKRIGAIEQLYNLWHDMFDGIIDCIIEMAISDISFLRRKLCRKKDNNA